MDNYTPKFKARLGIFIVGGIAIFVLAIFLIGKQQNLFNPVFKVTANFYNVSGLQVGNNIRFSGINVGIVDNIHIINDSTVQVDMLLRKNVQQFIKTDCKAIIGSEGLIGDRLIIITQGSTEALLVKDGQKLASDEPVETDAIIASLQISAGNTEVITKQLAEIMININSGQGTLGKLIQDSTVELNINEILENLKNSSEGLDKTIDMTTENVFSFMESLQKTVGKTEVASNQLGEIMTKINSGEGTLGRLIRDSTLANNLDVTVVNLKESSVGLNENMEALKHNFLFRGYFRRQAKVEEEKRIEQENQQASEIEGADEKK